MAQEEQEILDELKAEKESKAELDIYTSNSNTAMWTLILAVVTKSIRKMQLLWDAFLAELQAIADQAKPLTVPWYLARSYEFQYGYQLTVADGRIYYAVTDEAARIIKKAAVVDPEDGFVYFKLAKDNAGALGQLTADELNAFKAYMDVLQGAGDRLVISSLPADVLKISGKLFYDASIPEATVKANVAAALDTFLKSIEFNNDLSILKLEDALQKATGVVDFDLTYQAKPAGGSYATFTRKYSTSSGYIVHDSTAGSTLVESISWQIA